MAPTIIILPFQKAMESGQQLETRLRTGGQQPPHFVSSGGCCFVANGNRAFWAQLSELFVERKMAPKRGILNKERIPNIVCSVG